MENDFIPMIDLEEDDLPGTQGAEDDDEDEKNTPPATDPNEDDDEEEEEEEGGGEDDGGEDDDEGSSDEEAVSAAYKTLVSKNLLPQTDKPPKSWEELDELFEELPVIIADSLISSLPEQSQLLIDYVINNPNLTQESLQSFMNQYVNTLDSEDGDFDEDSAKAYLTKIYKSKGLSDKAITATLETHEDDGELLTVAQEERTKEKAVVQESLRKKADADKEAENQRKEANKQYWATVTQELTNKKWKPAKQQQTLTYLKDQGINKSLKEIYKNPNGLIELAEVLQRYDAKTGTFDFKNIKQEAESRATDNIKNNIVKDAFSTAFSKGTFSKKKKSDLENLEPVL